MKGTRVVCVVMIIAAFLMANSIVRPLATAVNPTAHSASDFDGVYSSVVEGKPFLNGVMVVDGSNVGYSCVGGASHNEQPKFSRWPFHFSKGLTM